jgi:hypothetical protein
MSKPETHEDLLKRINDRRRSIHSFVNNLEPKGVLLTNINIVCSAIATFLTGASAIGAKPLKGQIDPYYPYIFALAAVLSLVSVIVANLYKSHDMAAHLKKARACDAKLEGLETLLDLRKIDLNDAVTQYVQLLPEIDFISDNKWAQKDQSVLDWVQGEISKPNPGQLVDDVILCSGWAEGIGSALHLWLAVEIKGSIWPKEGEIFLDNNASWRKTIHQEGAGDSFSLSLFVANKKANRKIRAWLDESDESGDYQKMQRFPGLRRVARVDGLHRHKASSQSTT